MSERTSIGRGWWTKGLHAAAIARFRTRGSDDLKQGAAYANGLMAGMLIALQHPEYAQAAVLEYETEYPNAPDRAAATDSVERFPFASEREVERDG